MSETPSPAPIPSVEEALATVQAAELVLAKHREAPFAALLERIGTADLPGIAADLRAIAALVTAPADKVLIGNRADVLADVPKFVGSLAEANAAKLKSPGA